jgi:hypothetical protein
MKRAVELFRIERRPSPSPLVEETWRSWSVPEDFFISVAASHWQMVLTRQRGRPWLTVRGPESKATIVPIPAGAAFFGIQFSLGTFMPGLRPGELLDRTVTLPATDTSFRLGRWEWDLPAPDNVDELVDGLGRTGLLAHDPVASAALRGEGAGLSTRSVQRRVARATGLTQGTIRQIRRAERAVELLAGGVPVPHVAIRAGYADQPHLTRALTRFAGQTPSQIATGAAS